MTTAFMLALLAAAPQAAASSTAFEAEVRVGAPVTSGNLVVFPLTLRSRATATSTVTLDEALRSKVLRVAETGQGIVNSIEVENGGDRPVLLVAGELLLGGKQDRIVGRSLVLAPRSHRHVPVFCVEHGRWRGAGAFESARAMGHVELRKRAIDGDQGRVWAEVRSANVALGTTNATDTYRLAARKLGGEVGPLTRQVLDALGQANDTAGLAVAIDGEVVAVEWFGSPRVFAQLREKLVASYAAAAVAKTRPAEPVPAPPREADVAAFVAEAEHGRGVVKERVDDGAGRAVVQTYLKR